MAKDIEKAVRTAYAKLSKEPGDWVSLTRLRAAPGMRGIVRDQLDETLKLMNRQSGISIVPQSNQKMLTKADRDASVWIGNQNKHLIAITRANVANAAKKVAPAKKVASAKRADFESLSMTAVNPRFFDEATAQMSLRVAPALKAAVKAKAKSKGLTEAGYLRMLVIEDVSGKG